MFKMTGNILRNLVVKKSTRRYPYEVREPFAKVRGELVNDIDRCIFCGSCQVKCPSRCIEVDKQSYQWHYDPFVCVYCGVCVDICPAKSLFHKREYRKPTAERVTVSQQGQPRKKKEKSAKSPEAAATAAEPAVDIPPPAAAPEQS